MSMITTMTTDTSINMTTTMSTTMTTDTSINMTTIMVTIMTMDTTTITGTITTMTTAPRKRMTTANMSWRIITRPILMKRTWTGTRTNVNARSATGMKNTAIFAGRALPTANAVCRTRRTSSAFTN